MKITFYLAIALFIGYILGTILRFEKIPKSISDTHYMWKEIGYPYMFTAVMWVLAFLVLMYWVDVTPDKLKPLPFLSMSGLGFVGGACAFKETLTKGTHFTAAAIWAIFAILYFVLTQNYISILLGATTGIVGLILNRFKNFTFWAECACVAMMIFGIYMI